MDAPLPGWTPRFPGERPAPRMGERGVRRSGSVRSGGGLGRTAQLGGPVRRRPRGLGFDTITLLVPHPPRDHGQALRIAARIATRCPDALQQSDVETWVESGRKLVDRPVWHRWFDGLPPAPALDRRARY